MKSIFKTLYCLAYFFYIFMVCSSDNYEEHDGHIDTEDEIEYVDSSKTTSGQSVSRGDFIPKKEEGRGTTKVIIQSSQIPSHHSKFGKDFELGVGLEGGTRNQFVEVRIGEFSATDQFARVYGKLVNVSGSMYDEQPVQQISEFLGVPFAEPPVNHLRFQRPIMKAPFDELVALRHAPPCPQITASGSGSQGVTGNEDCLRLSIYVPGNLGNDNDFNRPMKMPVLIWFHGESPNNFYTRKLSMLSSGSAQDLDPFVFLQNKIIVVTPQFRLGSLGFLSVANEVLNGNMGMLDQVTALEWVQRYIAYFGGDPAQVTVMGQGSSATTLGLLSTSTASRSLFHRMILMSGSPSSPLALDTNQRLTFAEISKENHCPSFPFTQFVRCMQKKTVEDIVLADEQLGLASRHLGKFHSPLPVIQKGHDRRYLPPLIHEDPLLKIERGQFVEDVPVMIGVTSSEMGGFLPSLSGNPTKFVPNSTLFCEPHVLRQYIRQVLSRRPPYGLNLEVAAQLATFEYFAGLNISEREEQAIDLVEEMLSDYLYYIPALNLANLWSRYSPVYLYVFDYVPVSNYDDKDAKTGTLRRRQIGGSSPSAGAACAACLPIKQAIHGSDLLFLMNGYKGSAQDRYIAQVMIDTWVNFIHKGSVLQSGLSWPQYRENEQEYLHVSEGLQVRSRFRARQQQFWMELLKELGRTSLLECSSKSNKGGKSSGMVTPQLSQKGNTTNVSQY